MDTLKTFIQKHEAHLELLEFKSKIAWWNLAISGEESYSKAWQEAETFIRKIYASAEDYRFLKAQKKPHDQQLLRQTKLILDKYIEYQIPHQLLEEIVGLEAEIESIYTSFRPVADGKELSNNSIKELLQHSLDAQKRQKSWEASKQIGAVVETRVLKLVGLRNQAAKHAGFSNYYSMLLHLQELDEGHLFKILKNLEAETSILWKRYKTNLDIKLGKRFKISPKNLKPWHYQDPFFQEAPQEEDLRWDQVYKGKNIVDISRRFFLSIGLPVDDILNRSDLFERPKKNQHAFCISLNRKQDIRILCNLKDNEYWMGTQLHELGHAVYDKWIDPALPFTLRIPAHTCLTEAIAMLFGRLSKDPQFISKFCAYEMTANDLPNASQLLVFARWTLVMIYFERELYRAPQSDLNKFWWECVTRFQSIDPLTNRNAPDWASKLHLACAPAYYQNYILGELIASQLKHYIDQNFTNCFSQEAGQWLKNCLFQPGAVNTWEDTLLQATEEPLNPAYFTKDIA